VAGWAPYWRNEKDVARKMFEEALSVAQANPEGDPWAESRALGMIATVVEETGDDEESLSLASESLAIAEASHDRFSVAVARENVGNSLRRQARLDEALPHLDGAVEAFRELGARWELASGLTSRGILHRLARRVDLAVRDLREAYRLCKELKERSIVTWTSSELAKALVLAGDPPAARVVLEETMAMSISGGQGSLDWLYEAEAWVFLGEGDREAALEQARQALEIERERGWTKDVATATWWIGTVFGPDAAGGEEEMERARKLLESTHRRQAFITPDLATELLRR
jgi:tetratricopeptide (TPR) repeat protein